MSFSTTHNQLVRAILEAWLCAVLWKKYIHLQGAILQVTLQEIQPSWGLPDDSMGMCPGTPWGFCLTTHRGLITKVPDGETQGPETTQVLIWTWDCPLGHHCWPQRAPDTAGATLTIFKKVGPSMSRVPWRAEAGLGALLAWS